MLPKIHYGSCVFSDIKAEVFIALRPSKVIGNVIPRNLISLLFT